MKFIDSIKNGYGTLSADIKKNGVRPMDDKGITGKSKVPTRKTNKSMSGLELLEKATRQKA
jgi:hypothetical protein